MIRCSIKYCVIALLTLSIVTLSSFGCFADGKFDWGEWLEDEKDRDINDAMTYKEMAVVYENDRMELRINGDNGVFVMSDKSNGALWRSNPEDWKDETIVSGSAKESINSQLIIKCYSKSQRQFLTLNSYTHSCVEGGFSYEKNDKGYTATYNFPSYDITVKITVSVVEDGIEVAFSREGFSDTENYRAYELTVMPYLLSAGAEDSGYIFVPDGSGAIITLNKSFTDNEPYSSRIYGNSLSGINDPKDEVKAMLPVYALSKNGRSVMAVIEKGDALSVLSAAVKGQINNENAVYATYILRDYAFYAAGAYGSTDFDVFEKGELKQDEYKTVYTFFDNDKNEYYDFAKAFSDKYLNVTKEYDFDAVIDVLAATRKIKSFLGVPITQTEVMTNTDELSEILGILREKGVGSLAVKYSGAATSSLKNSVNSKLKIDSKVGSLKKLSSLADTTLESGSKLYIEYNPVKFVKGIFTSAKRVSRDLLGQYITLKTYKPSGVVNDEAKSIVLLKPSYFVEMTEKLSSSVKSKSFGLAPENIMSDIYTDYSKDSGNAVYTMDTFKSGIEKLSSSNGVMSKAAGFYALVSSEINTDIPTSSSNFDLFDRSVPFYEIVLSGKIPFSYGSINYSSDVETAFLKCVETGGLPKYSLYYRDKTLLRDSADTDWFSGNFEEWSDTVIAQLSEWNEVSKKIGTGEIISHKELANGVLETVFDSGYSVIVNYNDTEYISDTLSVSAKGYYMTERSVNS